MFFLPDKGRAINGLVVCIVLLYLMGCMAKIGDTSQCYMGHVIYKFNRLFKGREIYLLHNYNILKEKSFLKRRKRSFGQADYNIGAINTDFY